MQTKFLASMTLSPTHPQFPSSCLLHAILASSARMVSEDFFAQEEKYWGKDDHEETVADYHAVKAKVRFLRLDTPLDSTNTSLCSSRSMLPLREDRSSSKSLKQSSSSASTPTPPLGASLAPHPSLPH